MKPLHELLILNHFYYCFLLAIKLRKFSITTYYPPEPPLKHLLNPFRKN